MTRTIAIAVTVALAVAFGLILIVDMVRWWL